MSDSIKPTRSSYLDNIKGILIFLVVFGHFLFDYQDNNVVNAIVQIIYLFHMPAFVFISGYLSKSKNAKTINSLLKLFIAYFIFNGMFLILNILRHGEVSILIPYLSYWYLIAMIAWRATIEPLSKIKLALPLSVIIALAVGFCPFINNVLAISRIIAFYPFFLLGYKLDKSFIKKYEDMNSRKKCLLGILLLVLVIGDSLITRGFLDLNNDNLTMEAYENISELAIRALMFIISIIAILMLLVITSAKKLPLLTMAGRNSLSIFLLHRFFPLVYVKIIARVFGSAPSATIIITTSLVCSIGILLVFGLDFVNKLVNSFTSKVANLILRTKTSS